jgi:acetyl esterase/lipase
VRDNAEKFAVDPDRIAVCGFSAGGHVAASLAVGWNNPALDLGPIESRRRVRPNAAILGYALIDPVIRRGYTEPGYPDAEMDAKNNVLRRMLGSALATQEHKDILALQKHVGPDTCPCFIWQTADDPAVYVDNSLVFAQALAKNSIPFALHIFPKGVHGLALGTPYNSPNGKAEFDNPVVAQWVELCLEWLKDL